MDMISLLININKIFQNNTFTCDKNFKNKPLLKNRFFIIFIISYISLCIFGKKILCVELEKNNLNYLEKKKFSDYFDSNKINKTKNKFYNKDLLSNFDSPYSVMISPHTGNFKTTYLLHIDGICSYYPILVNIRLFIFDIDERELYDDLDFISISIKDCKIKHLKFKLPELRKELIDNIKSDYVRVNYNFIIRNKNGFIDHNDLDYQIEIKKSHDVIPFDIHNNPVRNNLEKIEKYKKLKIDEKKIILDKTIQNEKFALMTKDKILQDSILISQYLLSTDCESNTLIEEFIETENIEKFESLIVSFKYRHIKNIHLKDKLSSDNHTDFKGLVINNNDIKNVFSKFLQEDCHKIIQKTFEDSMKLLIENFQCESIDELILGQINPNNTVILAYLSVLYPSYGSSFFSENSFNDHYSMSNCLSTKGLNLLQKLNSTYNIEIENLSSEFMQSIFLTSSNIIETLNKNSIFSNRTYDQEFSLIINEETIKARSLIETQEKFFINNNFKKNTKIKSNNLIFLYEKIQKNTQYLQNNYKIEKNILLNFQDEKNQISANDTFEKIEYKNFSIQYEEIDSELIVSIPINYILEKYHLDEIFVSAIRYKNFPFLKNSNNTFADDILSIKIIDAISNQIIDVENLDEDYPIKIYLKKDDLSYSNLNTCLFFDDDLKKWNDYKCISKTNSNSDYLICDCYHLTEFAFSSINPVDIYKDFIGIIRDIRFINDLNDFRYCTFSNAGVIYMFLGFLMLFSLGFYYFLRREFTNNITENSKIENELFNDDNLYFYVENDEEIIVKKFFKKEAIQRNIRINLKKISQKCNMIKQQEGKNFDCISNGNCDFDKNLLSDDSSNYIKSYEQDRENKFNKSENEIKTHRIYINIQNNISVNEDKKYTLKFFFKRVFYAITVVAHEYRIVALFSKEPFIMNHFSILFIIFFDTLNFIAISSLISPNNSLSGDPNKTSYGYFYVNKKVAIYLIIIFFSKIPRIIISIFIKKVPIKNDLEKNEKEKMKKWLFVKYCFTYLFIFVLYVFFFINTFWISMNNVKNKRSNDFIYFFIISLFIKYCWIFIFILIKSVFLILFFKKDNSILDKIYVLFLNIYTFIP